MLSKIERSKYLERGSGTGSLKSLNCNVQLALLWHALLERENEWMLVYRHADLTVTPSRILQDGRNNLGVLPFQSIDEG